LLNLVFLLLIIPIDIHLAKGKFLRYLPLARRTGGFAAGQPISVGGLTPFGSKRSY
jgi:hypothetical protein